MMFAEGLERQGQEGRRRGCGDIGDDERQPDRPPDHNHHRICGLQHFVSGLCAVVLLSGILPNISCARPPSFHDRVAASLRQATDFFRTQVSTEGGYLWRYSEDLTRREGERTATSSMVWVQPQGTPSVGMAYLRAYDATRDRYYLEAARETADALVRGQLRSGGWDYHIEFDPQLRRDYSYRSSPYNEEGRNLTTLDDSTTQSALQLLMRVDQALEFEDRRIHESALYALEALLKAQYPNGAWPQRYEEFPVTRDFPVKEAGYPPSWFRGRRGDDYRGYYTFNDNTINDLIRTMLEASEIYQEPKYRQAAEKAGAFILLAQMPEPQPAWAQQYDVSMYPVWARKFEPPAISGGESQQVLRTLMFLYKETGDERYLEPLPRATRYLRRSALPDGRLARFYELKTNRPLYFTRDYQLTYRDADLPTHYAFKVSNEIEDILREYESLRRGSEFARPETAATVELTEELEEKVRQVLAHLDDQGRWLVEGNLRGENSRGPEQIIDCQTFIRNIDLLGSYLAMDGPR